MSSRLPNLADIAPALQPLGRARLAVPLLYIEFTGGDTARSNADERLRAQHKLAIAAALKSAQGRILRKGDLAAAGTGGRWFIVLLAARARRRKSLISDADLGIAADRLRRAVARALDLVNARLQRAVDDRVTVRCGWTVLELDAARSPLEDLRQAIRGAAVVARIEERRAVVLAAVTHELRTPLTSIVGFAERLQHDKLDRLQRARSVEIILDESRRLARLAEGLIDIGAWTSSHLQLRHQACDLKCLVERAIEAVAARALEKNVSVIASGRARVRVDPDRCLQICINLLDNAVRYAHPRSRIHVRLRTRGKQCVLAVTDTGPKFAQAVRRALGKPFACGVDGRVGLGLAISKVLAEAHHGSLSVSNTARGAQVAVTLPLKAKPPTPRRTEHTFVSNN